MTDDAFPQEIIRRKRDGESLDDTAIGQFVRGLCEESWSEGQVAALAMAICLRGMTRAETASLTRAMAASGNRLDWAQAALAGPVVDKHSTGGVGDKVSLILAPVLAAAGAFCPMISGRGLGHTGGTLDKLESIPGYDCAPDVERFRRTVRDVGAAIVGQTADLAPADRRLYAIRDVTATVESVPLITASILAKKLAAGLDALVMDVKVGTGAFMTTPAAARRLAQSLVATGAAAGLPTSAMLTDMNQVLGTAAGNALEVAEAVEFLTGGHRDPRLAGVVRALASEALRLSGLYDATAAPLAVDGALGSGSAAERFQQMVAGLGGPADFVERYAKHLEFAPIRRPVIAGRRGYLAKIDVRALGLAVMALGGGRRRTDERIDHAVGLSDVAGIGFRTGPRRPIAVVHARTEAHAETAARAVRAAMTLSESPPEAPPLVQELFGPGDQMDVTTN